MIAYSMVRRLQLAIRRITDREMVAMYMYRGFSVICCTALLMIAIGCTEEKTGVDTAEPTPPETIVPEPGALGTEDRTAVGNQHESGEATIDNKNDISVASPQKETIDPLTPDDLILNEEDWAQMEGSGKSRNTSGTRSFDVAGSFDASAPSLMGIAIGTNMAVVYERFGEPVQSYPLPGDSEDPAVVRSYPGFAIGERDNKVLFVEVSTRSVNPGLSGLRLGDMSGDAAAKLGKPTSESEFVMSYAANGSILKLDIDPDTKKIISMKLFPEE